MAASGNKATYVHVFEDVYTKENESIILNSTRRYKYGNERWNLGLILGNWNDDISQTMEWSSTFIDKKHNDSAKSCLGEKFEQWI